MMTKHAFAPFDAIDLDQLDTINGGSYWKACAGGAAAGAAGGLLGGIKGFLLGGFFGCLGGMAKRAIEGK
jgi:hypothetical protein